MGNAAHQRADRFHFLRLLQLRLQSCELLQTLLLANKVGDLTVAAQQWGDGQHGRVEVAIFLFVDHFALPWLAAEQRLPELFVESFVLIAAFENAWIFAQSLFFAEAGDRSEGGVDVLNFSRHIGDDDRFTGLPHGAGKQADFLCCLTALRDVPRMGQCHALTLLHNQGDTNLHRKI